MSDQKQLLDLLGQLTAELQDLSMAQTVQKSAYVVLVHQLASKGLVRPQTLAKDLLLMSEVQQEQSWKDHHEELASVLKALNVKPSTRRK